MHVWSVRIKTIKIKIIQELTPTTGSAVGFLRPRGSCNFSTKVNGYFKQSAIGLILETDPSGCQVLNLHGLPLIFQDEVRS
jgi:hypothetical protein